MPIWNARLAIDNFGTGLHANHCDKPHPNCIHDKKNQTATVLLSNYCYKQHSSSSITWMELPKYDRGTYVHSRWIFRKRGFSSLWDTVTEPSIIWSCFTSIGSGKYKIVCRRWPKINIITLKEQENWNKFFRDGKGHYYKSNLLPMGWLILWGCGQNCIFWWSSPFLLNNLKWIQIGRKIMRGLCRPIELHLKPETKAMNRSFTRQNRNFRLLIQELI